jgi:AraC-like DNA-binding protein
MQNRTTQKGGECTEEFMAPKDQRVREQDQFPFCRPNLHRRATTPIRIGAARIRPIGVSVAGYSRRQMGRSISHSMGEIVAGSPSLRYRRIVDEVEIAARKFATEPLRLRKIYENVSVGPGMIRLAFRAVHGCSPRRFLREQRLRAVHAELNSGRPGVTVTQVATSHGFVELGRFAAQYQTLFGEGPSATLRCALARRASADV